VEAELIASSLFSVEVVVLTEADLALVEVGSQALRLSNAVLRTSHQ
jgi:hypothetical protein